MMAFIKSSLVLLVSLQNWGAVAMAQQYDLLLDDYLLATEGFLMGEEDGALKENEESFRRHRRRVQQEQDGNATAADGDGRCECDANSSNNNKEDIPKIRILTHFFSSFLKPSVERFIASKNGLVDVELVEVGLGQVCTEVISFAWLFAHGSLSHLFRIVGCYS